MKKTMYLTLSVVVAIGFSGQSPDLIGGSSLAYAEDDQVHILPPTWDGTRI